MPCKYNKSSLHFLSQVKYILSLSEVCANELFVWHFLQQSFQPLQLHNVKLVSEELGAGSYFTMNSIHVSPHLSADGVLPSAEPWCDVCWLQHSGSASV